MVKGVNFVGLKDVGDPIELAKKYDVQCADEVVFLDITASYEDRGIMKDIIERGASELTIPLAVGGGIRTLDDFRMILASGADKVSVNSAAIINPQLINSFNHFPIFDIQTRNYTFCKHLIVSFKSIFFS